MRRDTTVLANKDFDVIVVGAGIYGAAVAWDAVCRGLRVALIDKGDFGGRTSSNSLKIMHGGLRYLQQLDFKRMRESVRERMISMRIAPHLVHPLGCVMPTYGHMMKGKEVMFVGLLMNDIISLDRNQLGDPEKTIPMGRVISRDECLRLIPGIDANRITGGAFWTDAQVYNTERYILSFILSSVERGTVAANYVGAESLLLRKGRVEGVKAVDMLTGDKWDIRARMVINTCGGWVDDILQEVNKDYSRVNLSTAMNLVINRKLLPECAAGIVAKFEHKRSNGSVYQGTRVLFMTPWRNVTLVGTYHLPFNRTPDTLCVTEGEIQTFLKEVNTAFKEDPVLRKDISFFYKGFLPYDGVNEKTGEVILTKHYSMHDHLKEEGLEGIITVVGVKFTTARDVAERAVDLVFKKLGKKSPPCETTSTPLFGGEIELFDDFLADASDRSSVVSPDVIRHLIFNYGSKYTCIVENGTENTDLYELVQGSSEVIKAEVVHGIREEMALKLTDIVLRRTDLGSAGNPGDQALKTCAEIMAGELGWDNNKIQEELEEAKGIYTPDN